MLSLKERNLSEASQSDEEGRPISRQMHSSAEIGRRCSYANNENTNISQRCQ
jgi:hypothetical protein